MNVYCQNEKQCCNEWSKYKYLYLHRFPQVECRGCVGETVFHVCFLMGTPIHMHLAKVEHNKENFIKMFHLAKRMLKHFPLLLNDIYLSEEYYGENVLHMAAVAEVIMANYRIKKCCIF